MKTGLKSMLVLGAAAIFFAGCPDGSGGDDGGDGAVAVRPATSVRIEALEGTDFGTVAKGESVTKKFKITADGYLSENGSVGAPAGFDDTDFEKERQKMVEERTTTATFTVTFSPVFDGVSSGDLTVITAITGGDSFKLPVTAKGTGVGLKAPDAADRTMTVKYYLGDAEQTGATSLNLTPDNPAGKVEVTIDYYAEYKTKGSANGPFVYAFEAFPNTVPNTVVINIGVSEAAKASESENAFFYIEGKKIDLYWNNPGTTE